MSSENMENLNVEQFSLSLDGGLDKECHLLGGLFNQIISEMKVRNRFTVDKFN